MLKAKPNNFIEIAKYGILLGIAGGLAEVLWIAFYGFMTGTDTAEVARAISAAVGWMLPGISLGAAPVIFGIAAHMLAAIGIGIALVLAWRAFSAHRSAWSSEYTFMLGALAIIWAFNFFVVLPLISPSIADLQRAFVELVPYPASLLSKLLFGLAGAIALRFRAGSRRASNPISS